MCCKTEQQDSSLHKIHLTRWNLLSQIHLDSSLNKIHPTRWNLLSQIHLESMVSNLPRQISLGRSFIPFNILTQDSSLNN